jgi:hypothetical protein
MAKKKKIAFDAGDIFVMPLENEAGYGVGVVVKLTPDALNSVVCSFYDIKLESIDAFNINDINEKNLISVQFTTPDLLQEGIWELIGKTTAIDPNNYFNFEELKVEGYIGAKIRGSSNIREFISAYLGVHHWNCFFKDDYLDDFLLHPEDKPSCIYFIEK